MKLNADHSTVCKFWQDQADRDNWKLVRSNIRDLYRNALKTRESPVLSPAVGERLVNADEELRKQFASLQETRI